MWKLLCIAALCLFHSIAASDIENGNSGDHDARFTNSSNTLSTEQSVDALGVTTPLPDSEMKPKVLISLTKPEEMPSTPEGQQDLVKSEWKTKQLYQNKTEASLVNPESVLIGGLSKNSDENEKIEIGSSIYTEDILNVTTEKNASNVLIGGLFENSSNEKERSESVSLRMGNILYPTSGKNPVSSALISGLSENSSNTNETSENVGSIRTGDILHVTSEKSTSKSILEGKDLTITGTDVSNQSLVADFHKISQTNFDSNVDLAVNENSSILTKNETIQEYTTHSSTPHEYPEKEEFSASTITEMMEYLTLKSFFSRKDVKPVISGRDNFSNPDGEISREDELTTLDDQPTTSTSFASENSDYYLQVVTKDFKPLPPERKKNSNLDAEMSRRVKFTAAEDPPTNTTFLTSENSEGNLFATTVGKIFEYTDSTLTTEDNFFISESLDNDGQELNSSHPTVNESSMIYKEENIDSYSIMDTTQENSTTYSVNVYGENTFVETSPVDNASPISLDKLAKNFSFIPEEFFSPHLTDTTYHNQNDSEKVSFVSTPDSSRQNVSDYVPERTESPSPKQILRQSYKLILTRNCSEDVISSQTFQSVSEIFNSRLKAQNSTEFMKCVSVYEFNFTSDIAFEESFDDIIHLMQETMDPNLEASIVNYDSIVHHIPRTRRDSENFVVPKLIVYITTATTIVIITFMIFVVLVLRKRCKKSSSSLDLSDIPHIALSVDDYKVAPIPRPSVSFPESNRDFLYAYSNETYNRTQDDIMVQRHFSKMVGKEIEATKMQKDSSLPLEMQTFTRNGGDSRNKSDSKSAPDYEFASAGYWDRLRGRGVGKKQGLDNPAMKW